jgi:hypothetical protein
MVKKRSYATAANYDGFHRCFGCVKTLSTMKGYRNHLSQSQKCKHGAIHLKDIVSKRGKSTAKGSMENNRKDPPLAEENNQKQATSSSFQEDIDTFEDEDEEHDVFNNNDTEVQVEFDIQEQDEIYGQDNMALDDTKDTGIDMGVVMDVPCDP